MITPKPLYPGARVALVCASSAVPADALPSALETVRALGLEPVPFPSCFERNRRGYLAASDDQRAGDVNSAFADPDLEGVFCLRGGYGAHRILPLLDLKMIAAHPKYFSGYSDVTALHTAFNQCCRFITYHTVMPSTPCADLDGFTLGYLRRALSGALAGPVELPPGAALRLLAPGKNGRVAAPLCGGNLSLLAASLGTPWEIDTRGKLLFLEDVGEKTYRIDAMLTQLRNAGKFGACCGVLLGAWTDCTPEDPGRTLTLEEIFTDLIVPAGKPVLSGVPCGHVLPTLALPLGGTVLLDAGAASLEILP